VSFGPHGRVGRRLGSALEKGLRGSVSDEPINSLVGKNLP
jgi:hypothetical protein